MIMSEIFINKEYLLTLIMQINSKDISELQVHQLFNEHGAPIKN